MFKKLLVGGLGLLLILVLLAAFLVVRSIDAIAAAVIERGGSHVLGVTTTVDSADVGITSGTFELANLTVANPAGYDSPHFMNLPSAGVEVSLNTLLENTIELPALTVGVIDMNLDRSGGRGNYEVILENVKKTETGEKPAEPAGDGPTKKFIVRSLVLEGASVHVVGFGAVTDAVGDVKVDVPRIELEDVGSEEPLTTGELISLIVKVVLSTTIENGGGVLPADLVGNLHSRLSNLTGLDELGITAIGDVGAIRGRVEDQVKGAIDDAREKIEKDLGDLPGKLPGGLGDALGGGKKKEKKDGG